MFGPLLLRALCAMAALLPLIASATVIPWTGPIQNVSSGAPGVKTGWGVNDRGHVAWSGSGTWYWDGTSATNLSAGGTFYGIGAGDRVVWQETDALGYGDIYTWDPLGNTNTNISNTYGVNDRYASIGPSGQVAWEGNTTSNSYDIFLWDGTSKADISNLGGGDYSPRFGTSGDLCWYSSSLSGWYWDGSSVRLLGYPGSVYGVQMDGSDNVFAQVSIGGKLEIMRWEKATNTYQNISQTPSDTDDYGFSVRPDGTVAWAGRHDGLTDRDIYYWDGSTKTNISNSTGMDTYPGADPNGEWVVWIHDNLVYAWDGDARTYQVSPDPAPGHVASYSGASINNGWIVYGDGADVYRTHIPEPGTFALLGLGVAALAFWRRRRKA